jgi:hypothetical protein
VLKYVAFMSKLQYGVLPTLLVTVNVVFSPCFGWFLWLERLWISSLIHLWSIDPAWFEFSPSFYFSVAENLMSGDAAVLTMSKFHILQWFLFIVNYWPTKYAYLICTHMKSFSMSKFVLKYVAFTSKQENAVLPTLLVIVNMVFSPCFGWFLWLERLWISSLLHLCSIDPAWFEFSPLFHSTVAENLMSGYAAVRTMSKIHIL